MQYRIGICRQAREDYWTETELETNDPKLAVEKWFELSQRNPMDAFIDTTRCDSALALITYCKEHMNWLENLCDNPKFPYKSEHMVKAITSEFSSGCRSFTEYDLGDGDFAFDSIYPFCVG